MAATTEWKTVRVSDGSDMRVFVARPSNKRGPLPAILVLQEAFGVNAHIRDVTQRIAELGYVTAAPELYHRTAPGFESGYDDTKIAMEHFHEVTETGMEADLHAAYEALIAETDVNKERVAAVGYCMGGRAAFLANAALPLVCAVSYYGGGIAERLALRVKDQHGPVLFFWGGQDAHLGPAQHYATVAALRESGKSFIDVEFSDAGHGFFCDARKTYHQAAAQESWALMTAFLARHLIS